MSKKYLRVKVQNRVTVKKLTVANLVNKLPAFWPIEYITVFTIPAAENTHPVYILIPCSFMIHFNIIFISPSQTPCPFRISDKSTVCFLHLPHACQMPHPYYPTWRHHLNNVWFRMYITKSSDTPQPSVNIPSLQSHQHPLLGQPPIRVLQKGWKATFHNVMH